MSAVIAGLIPKIEGFQPIPNAVMIPFMEVQSAALAYGFGLNYEFSKRKIRSMSNEQFNALTPQDVEEMQARHTAVLLEGFIKRVPAVMPAQSKIFDQYVTIEKLKVQQNVELAKWMVRFAKDFIDDETAHFLGGHMHDTAFQSDQQTYYDPNNPKKDFVPPNKPTSDFPPSGVPKTNIPIPKPDLNPDNIKATLIRIGNRDQWTEYLNTTKTIGTWKTILALHRNLLAAGTRTKQMLSKDVGTIYQISNLIHQTIGKWF